MLFVQIGDYSSNFSLKKQLKLNTKSKLNKTKWKKIGMPTFQLMNKFTKIAFMINAFISVLIYFSSRDLEAK